MLDFINVNRYEELADFYIIPQEDKLFTSEFLKRDGIIFAKTDYIDYLFDNIKFSPHKYALITNHSDYLIDFNRFSKKPLCIKKWYAVQSQYRHPDLIALPLGLYAHKGFTKNVFVKFDIDWLLENHQRFYDNEKNLGEVYCNWNSTNADRNNILKRFNKNGIKYHWETGLTFEEYCESMSKFKFVISPPGNGIDCFRTYEALYFNCIPIVIKNYIYDCWKELPIIQVNDYSEVTYDLLYSYLNKEYNMEKLYFTYWKNLINSWKN